MSICAIWGAPQSGKTTLAINLAYAFSRRGKTVCVISPLEYSEFSVLLGVKIPKEQSLGAALHGSENIRNTVFRVDDLLYVLATEANADAFDCSYTSERVKTLLDIAKVTFDLVIVDCPSETNNIIAAWSLNRAEKILLCLGGHISCTQWQSANKRALQTVQQKTIYIGNHTAADFDYGALYSYLKCTPQLEAPYVSEATTLQNDCKPIYGGSGKNERAYSSAINKLVEVLKL
ncbi:MAG: AAA family ATPase [Oscillospiraceae bacterium]